MPAELHVLNGNRAGLVLALDGAGCTVGRHPGCSLRFGAEADGVSARHARLLRDGAEWVVRDLGSTNGTWLNGRRVRGDAVLRDGDRLAFGQSGPSVELRLPGAVRVATPVEPEPRAVRPRHPWAVGAGAACVLLAGTAAVLVARRPPAAPMAEARASAVGTGLRPALPSAAPAAPRPSAPRPAPAVSASAAPRSSPPSSPGASARHPLAKRAPAAVIRARPESASVQTPAPRRALLVDRLNRLAVARIYVESEDGEVATGTAFAVRADGTLATNRHVVGGRPRRIAVQFTGSTQVWRARVVAVSGAWDLALVKVDDVEGAVPIVRGLNLRPDTLAAGSPVALAGFPRGGEPVEGAVIRATVVQAELAGVRGGRVEVFARSGVGASGSPLFDADGRVIGILFGGSPGAARPVLYAVPAPALARLVAER
jgi:S1-C subfamily serine protease